MLGNSGFLEYQLLHDCRSIDLDFYSDSVRHGNIRALTVFVIEICELSL